jgi:hypothetical protein
MPYEKKDISVNARLDNTNGDSIPKRERHQQMSLG